MASTAIDRALDPGKLDAALERLQGRKEAWAQLGLEAKAELLREAQGRLGGQAQRWVEASAAGKKLDLGSRLVGEEWATGPYALAKAMVALLGTLTGLQQGKAVLPTRTRARSDGQLVAQVFPLSIYDRILLSGVSAEVWMQPGVTRENLESHTAQFYKQSKPAGGVALVLGAGNINVIAPLDMLYKMYAEGQVVILKLNPVNDYLGPILADVFKPFIDAGYLEIVCGGADVGAYLTEHKLVESIHITGSARTHDIIMFGRGEEGVARKKANNPKLNKPITSELGGVGATIVVPGPWSQGDCNFQAENITAQKLVNAGNNCIAVQVLVLPRSWDKSKTILDAVREQFELIPERPMYYPGAEERLNAASSAGISAGSKVERIKNRVLITDVDPNKADEYCFHEEFFTTALAQTYLDGDDPLTYLRNAVDFVNDKVDGTLGVQLLIHPKTIKLLGDELEKCLAKLRFGIIGVNIWCGAAFALPHVAWGAYPGHTIDDIQSGIGVVHNAFLFDKPQKNIIYGPFWEAPRGILHGYFGVLPKPPWFLSSKTGTNTMKLMTEFELNTNVAILAKVVASTLRG